MLGGLSSTQLHSFSWEQSSLLYSLYQEHIREVAQERQISQPGVKMLPGPQHAGQGPRSDMLDPIHRTYINSVHCGLLEPGGCKFMKQSAGGCEKLLEPHQAAYRHQCRDTVDQPVPVQVEAGGGGHKARAAGLEHPGDFLDAVRGVWQITEHLNAQDVIEAFRRKRYVFDVRKPNIGAWVIGSGVLEHSLGPIQARHPKAPASQAGHVMTGSASDVQQAESGPLPGQVAVQPDIQPVPAVPEAG